MICRKHSTSNYIMYPPIHLIYNYTLILYGAKSIDAETVWNALFHFDSSDVNL